MIRRALHLVKGSRAAFIRGTTRWTPPHIHVHTLSAKGGRRLLSESNKSQSQVHMWHHARDSGDGRVVVCTTTSKLLARTSGTTKKLRSDTKTKHKGRATSFFTSSYRLGNEDEGRSSRGHLLVQILKFSEVYEFAISRTYAATVKLLGHVSPAENVERVKVRKFGHLTCRDDINRGPHLFGSKNWETLVKCTFLYKHSPCGVRGGLSCLFAFLVFVVLVHHELSRCSLATSKIALPSIQKKKERHTRTSLLPLFP